MLKFVTTSLIVLQVAAFSTAFAKDFPDVQDTDWYAPYVHELERDGVVEGYPDGRFGSWDPVNRAELAKMLSIFKQSLSQSQPLPWYERHLFEIILSLGNLLGWIIIIRMLRSGAFPESGLAKSEDTLPFPEKPATATDTTSKISDLKNTSTNWWI